MFNFYLDWYLFFTLDLPPPPHCEKAIPFRWNFALCCSLQQTHCMTLMRWIKTSSRSLSRSACKRVKYQKLAILSTIDTFVRDSCSSCSESEWVSALVGWKFQFKYTVTFYCIWNGMQKWMQSRLRHTSGRGIQKPCHIERRVCVCLC